MYWSQVSYWWCWENSVFVVVVRCLMRCDFINHDQVSVSLLCTKVLRIAISQYFFLSYWQLLDAEQVPAWFQKMLFTKGTLAELAWDSICSCGSNCCLRWTLGIRAIIYSEGFVGAWSFSLQRTTLCCIKRLHTDGHIKGWRIMLGLNLRGQHGPIDYCGWKYELANHIPHHQPQTLWGISAIMWKIAPDKSGN